MKELREAFERALADPGAVDEAIQVAHAILAAHGQIPVVTAYLGSLLGLKADAATLPWVKLRHANEAVAMLDDAYARRHEFIGATDLGEPDAELAILLLRGIAYASFPGFLGHGGAARDCLEQAIRHTAFSGIPQVYRALVISHLADLDHRTKKHEFDFQDYLR